MGLVLKTLFTRGWQSLVAWVGLLVLLYTSKISIGSLLSSGRPPAWATILLVIALIAVIECLVWTHVTDAKRSEMIERLYGQFRYKIGIADVPSSFEDPVRRARMLRRLVKIDWRGLDTPVSVTIQGTGGQIYMKTETNLLKALSAGLDNKDKRVYVGDYDKINDGLLTAKLVDKDSDEYRKFDAYSKALRPLSTVYSSVWLQNHAPKITIDEEPVRLLEWSDYGDEPSDFDVDKMKKTLPRYYGGDWDVFIAPGGVLKALRKDEDSKR